MDERVNLGAQHGHGQLVAEGDWIDPGVGVDRPELRPREQHRSNYEQFNTSGQYSLTLHKNGIRLIIEENFFATKYPFYLISILDNSGGK